MVRLRQIYVLDRYILRRFYLTKLMQPVDVHPPELDIRQALDWAPAPTPLREVPGRERSVTPYLPPSQCDDMNPHEVING